MNVTGFSAEWAAAWAAILSALIGAAAVILAVYIGDWLPSGAKKRLSMAGRLEEFATVLLSVAEDVARGDRPTQYGHRLALLLTLVDDKVRKRIGDVALNQFKTLEELGNQIAKMDDSPENLDRMRVKWVHDAKAIAGEFQAIGANLRG